MSDPLSSVGPGEFSPLLTSAASVNAVLEAARAHRARKGGAPTGPGSVNDPLVPALQVYVRNDTGGSLVDAFAVVALADAVTSPVDAPLAFRRQPVFSGTAPAAATDPFAVVTEPLTAGKLGRGAVAGVTPVVVNFTDEAHEYARPAAGVTTSMDSAETGPARILWRAPGTGARRAVVLIDQGGDGSAASSSDGMAGSKYGVFCAPYYGQCRHCVAEIAVPAGGALLHASLSLRLLGLAGSGTNTPLITAAMGLEFRADGSEEILYVGGSVGWHVAGFVLPDASFSRAVYDAGTAAVTVPLSDASTPGTARIVLVLESSDYVTTGASATAYDVKAALAVTRVGSSDLDPVNLTACGSGAASDCDCGDDSGSGDSGGGGDCEDAAITFVDSGTATGATPSVSIPVTLAAGECAVVLIGAYGVDPAVACGTATVLVSSSEVTGSGSSRREVGCYVVEGPVTDDVVVSAPSGTGQIGAFVWKGSLQALNSGPALSTNGSASDPDTGTGVASACSMTWAVAMLDVASLAGDWDNTYTDERTLELAAGSLYMTAARREFGGSGGTGGSAYVGGSATTWLACSCGFPPS